MKTLAFRTANWFVANPMRVRMIVLTLVFVLMMVALLAPGVVTLADNVPLPGGH